jgi:quercetin dioxygenase-like cupin family protein
MTAIGDLVSLKAFDSPDETRLFEKGRFDIVRIGDATVGRATYQPGWRWSAHVGPAIGASRCEVAHLGYVVSGRGTAALDDGRVFELTAGTLFHIPAIPHDSWVIGDEPYVSLHLIGASHYAVRR